jgi:hypothetical protein
MWQFTSVIPALGRQRKEDLKFKVRLGQLGLPSQTLSQKKNPFLKKIKIITRTLSH